VPISGIDKLDATAAVQAIARLSTPQTRQEGAQKLARHLGAEAFLILVLDPDTASLCPAVGFPPTLPGGPTWRDFMARCAASGEFEADVAFPTSTSTRTARACVLPDGTVFALIGGAPTMGPSALARRFPFLAPLMRAEHEALGARGIAAAAQEAERQAATLAAALDRSRRDLSTTGLRLRHAFDEADRLNAELRDLNANLEQRVADETSERLKAEESLRQAQKMEAIGQLTGGIAHDFNNLLTVILGGLDSIQRLTADFAQTPEMARLRRSCALALQASRQAATLTSRLLAFGRRQPLDPNPCDISRLVSGLADLLKRTIGEHISLEIVSGAGLWLAEVDGSELERAVLNLAVNARDAMPGGGKLTMETGRASLDETYVAELAEPVAPGQYVMLAVTDTGSGMDKTTIDRVFEPFFTTKGAGKGTGLGLSQVYGFVRQSNGHIRIYSEPGLGTTVKIYLPRTHKALANVPVADVPERAALVGDETILVVEDHPELRAYTTGVLRDLGYRVLEAASGTTALDLLESSQDVKLLFTDVVLPDGIDGRRLAEEANRRRPDLKVLYTTGYTRNAIVHNGRLDIGVQLIMKPFTRERLALMVRQLLDATG
jgi:signal transduction histidine kinase